MQCEYYALEGLSDLVGTIKKVRANLNPGLEIEGLLRTMYDPRNTLAQQVSQQLEAAFRRQGLPHRDAAQRAARRGAELRRAGAWCATPTSKGAQAYLALAGEMLERRDNAHDQTQGTGPRPRRTARRGDEPPREATADAAGRRASGPGSTSRAPDGPGGARRARRLDPGAGRDAADPGAAGRTATATRSSPASAAGARRSMAGLDEVPALVREVPDDAALAHGADREHPARGPESAGGGRRPAAPGRRVRA